MVNTLDNLLVIVKDFSLFYFKKDMAYKILLCGLFSLICCNLFAQFDNTEEFKRTMSMEASYLKKAEKKTRKSKCYRHLKKEHPSIVNGKTRIIYSLKLKKKLTREEFTYRNIMDNLEFSYHNSRKFPDNHVYLYDTKANVEFSYEEGWGVFCLYEYKGSGWELKNYIIPSHVTIDSVQPEFVFMAISATLYFLVKDNEIYVLLDDNKLVSLSDFAENHYDKYVK